MALNIILDAVAMTKEELNNMYETRIIERPNESIWHAIFVNINGPAVDIKIQDVGDGRFSVSVSEHMEMVPAAQGLIMDRIIFHIENQNGF